VSNTVAGQLDKQYSLSTGGLLDKQYSSCLKSAT